jgi:FMN phosphatase YigB (HAD superfamily)
MEDKDYCQTFRIMLGHLKGKKILVYGTGVIATRILDALSDFDIVGIIDNLKFMGDFHGKPIIMWDDVKKEDNIDVVIIASLPQNYQLIYKRIMHKCRGYGITVYGSNGTVILENYDDMVTISLAEAMYFKKSKDKLLKIIDSYDAISFDLFDTLIMRKTLYPIDVFEVVEKELKKQNIFLNDFKKYRREAELRSDGKDIYHIYEILQDLIGISDATRDIALKKELETERKCLIPRKTMVEVMEYALKHGKRVNIISDMYLTSDFLDEILRKLEIQGYEKIYVSCEHGCGKCNGLFEVYKQDVYGLKCLHIGDNYNADFVAAQKSGMAAYEIKSAYELLECSSYSGILDWTNNYNERNMVGLLISELFNDPFVLYNSSGFVTISDLKQIGKFFAAPMAVIYMHELVKIINSEKYDGVILTARDGYIFKRLFELWIKKGIVNEDTQIIYTLASRKLAMSATINSDEDIKKILKYHDSVDTITKYLLEILDSHDILPYSDNEYVSLEEYLLAHSEYLYHSSHEINKGYRKYMESQGIRLDGKYLICDLVSSGTVHFHMNKIFKYRQTGFYLCKTRGYFNWKLDFKAVYLYKYNASSNCFAKNTNFLETIFTSPFPSVVSMDSGGKPIYAKEVRTDYEINAMKQMQDGLMEFCSEYLDGFYDSDVEICKELPESILLNIQRTFFDGECAFLNDMQLVDDASTKRFKIIN